MPRGLVQEGRAEPIAERDLAEVRWCLSKIRTNQRPMLFAALDLVRTATITANPRLLDRVVADLPAGSAIWATIVGIARRRLAELNGPRRTARRLACRAARSAGAVAPLSPGGRGRRR